MSFLRHFGALLLIMGIYFVLMLHFLFPMVLAIYTGHRWWLVLMLWTSLTTFEVSGWLIPYLDRRFGVVRRA